MLLRGPTAGAPGDKTAEVLSMGTTTVGDQRLATAVAADMFSDSPRSRLRFPTFGWSLASLTRLDANRLSLTVNFFRKPMLQKIILNELFANKPIELVNVQPSIPCRPKLPCESQTTFTFGDFR